MLLDHFLFFLKANLKNRKIGVILFATRKKYYIPKDNYKFPRLKYKRKIIAGPERVTSPKETS